MDQPQIRTKKVPVLSAVAEAAAVRQIWLTRRGTSFRVTRFLVGHANTRSCPGSKMSNLARGSLSLPLLSRTFVDRRTDCFRLRRRQFSFCYSENCWRFLLRLVCPRITVTYNRRRKTLSRKALWIASTIDFPCNRWYIFKVFETFKKFRNIGIVNVANVYFLWFYLSSVKQETSQS